MQHVCSSFSRMFWRNSLVFDMINESWFQKSSLLCNDKNTNNSFEVNYIITDRSIFTQHFVQSSFFQIQDCCRIDRQWKMLSMFIHSHTVMLNSFYFAFDSLKHGSTRKQPDQIISKHLLLPIWLCQAIVALALQQLTALLDLPVR